jgi:membrane associated rhomboid family serine protease
LQARPAGVPPFWRPVGDGAHLLTSEQTLAQWALVLTAKNIPFCFARRGGRRLLYVPPPAENLARREIADYTAERIPPPAPVLAPAHTTWPLAFFFRCLVCWHLLGTGRISLPETSFLNNVFDLGALDVYRTRNLHEWHRPVTALTLHADAAHLAANIAAGGICLALLCRHTGVGAGLLLTALGGVLGNVCNALYRPPAFSSLGFSTAVFAALGALTGIRVLRGGGDKALLPLGAGTGLFAMLGTAGAHTDYAAHLFGALAGLILGAGTERLLGEKNLSSTGQIAAGTICMGLFAVAWRTALG